MSTAARPQRATNFRGPDLGLAVLDARRQARLALLRVTSPLDCRPAPRREWDDLARADTFTRFAVVDRDVDMCRRALQAASGNSERLMRVRAFVVAYYVAKAEAALTGYELEAEMALVQLTAHVVKELGEGASALARYLANPSPSNGHAALVEVGEAHEVSRAAAVRIAAEMAS